MSLHFERPRLAVHVQARVHVADGATHVVLYDPRTDTTAQIGLDDWHLVQQADGTRDLDALCLAAARLGIDPSEAGVRGLFGELEEAGMLCDGLALKLRTPPVPPTAQPPDDTPLEILEDFSLTCDGRGACCRFYGSVGFTPVEALRGRLQAAAVSLPVDDADLFVPMSGGQIDHPDEPLAVALVDGRCAFLTDTERCGIHERAGALAKPAVCRIYPAAFVHDGTAMRVSLVPECACIFSSLGVPGGALLTPAGATKLGDIEPQVGFREVPDPVPLTARATASRAELRRWSLDVHALARRADRDAAGWALALADAIEATGELGAVDIAPAPLDAARPWVEAFRVAVTAAAATQDAHRGVTDLSRRAARWAADALATRDPLTEPANPADEGFYLAALAFGHRLAIEGRPIARGLRGRAARILVARAMAAYPPPIDPAAAHPLALVEAATRNLGISGFGDDVD
ncbi:MAG: YkgJ family cysteine cluster protein [Sandaracinaceae bacterium]|nr:YkgJ family cysteine cluster protein [Sandaracinaceae bacterium]